MKNEASRTVRNLSTGIVLTSALALAACSSAGTDGEPELGEGVSLQDEVAHNEEHQHDESHERGPQDADDIAYDAIEVDGTLVDSTGVTLSPDVERIVRANADAEQRLGLLARVELQGEQMVEFYQPRDGYLLISGTGPAEDPPLDPADTRPTAAEVRELLSEQDALSQDSLRAFWDALTQGAVMPPAFEASLTKMGDVALRFPTAAPEETGVEAVGDPADSTSGVGRVQQAVHSGSHFCNSGWETFNAPSGYPWFTDVGHNCPSADEAYCKDHLHTNDKQSNGDTHILRTAVCVIAGTLKMRLDSGDPIDAVDGNFTVKANHHRWAVGIDQGCSDAWYSIDQCPTSRVFIEEVSSSEEYNWRYLVENGGF